MRLFPAIRADDEQAIVTAAGVACQVQIEDRKDRSAVHPIILCQHYPISSAV